MKPGERHAPETYRVCPAHEEEFRRFHARTARCGYRFFALFVLLMAAGFVLVPFASDVTVGIFLAVLAVVMLVFPFATPQTVRLMGVRASVWLVRGIAAVVLAWAAYLLVRALG